MKHLLLLAALSCLVLPLAACGDDSPTEQGAKGPEELELSSEGKADSFFRPTEFGTLEFKESVEAAFEDDKIFHSWTFTLSGEGEFFVETDPASKKTDTVMYLYRRAPGKQGWGRYILKNDDRAQPSAQRSDLSSRLEWSHDAGDEEVEYRVIVKPYRKDTRAAYTLHSGCEGAGCFTDDVDSTLTCESTQYVGGDFRFTQGCANALDALVRSPIVHPNDATVECLEERAIDLYKQTEVYDYLVSDYGEAETNDSLTSGFMSAHQLGAILSVDAGGDEDAHTFILDPKGDLFLSRWENQTSVNEWSCGERGDAVHGDGDLDDTCMSLITYNTALWTKYSEEVVAQGSGVVGANVDNEFAQIALDYAVDKLNVKPGSPFTYSHTGKLDLQTMLTLQTRDADGDDVRVDFLQELGWKQEKYDRYLYTSKVAQDVTFLCEQVDSVPVK